MKKGPPMTRHTAPRRPLLPRLSVLSGLAASLFAFAPPLQAGAGVLPTASASLRMVAAPAGAVGAALASPAATPATPARATPPLGEGATPQAWADARAAARAIADALAQDCPLAGPGDGDAFNACRRALFVSAPVQERLGTIVLWGRQRDPQLTLKASSLTQFAPDVLTGMYLPLFMFNGEHSVRWVASEGLFQIRLATAFRNRLQPGQFPYPFWHEAEKWAMYQNASEVLMWWDPGSTRVTVAQFTVHGQRAPLQAVNAVPAPAFDGRWMWQDAQGQAQPKVSLFDGLYRADNPHLARLDATYRTLALRLREGQCANCHVPNNPDKSRRLVLLQTPAHAAGEVQRLLKSVRDDRMPRDEAGIEQPLDSATKRALLEDGEAFAAAVDAARRWEAERAPARATLRLPLGGLAR